MVMRRSLVSLLVMSLLAALLAVVPDAIRSPTAAEPAPVAELPPCLNGQGEEVGHCPPDTTYVDATVSGRLQEGATATITQTPKVAACHQWPQRANWSPSPCYHRIEFSTFGLSCVYAKNGHLQTQPCGSFYSEGISRSSTPDITLQRPGGGGCGGAGDFQTYIYGGPANEPDRIWSAVGPTRLDCEVTWNWPTPDELEGPTWLRIRYSMRGGMDVDSSWSESAYAYIPLDGELRNPGPDASFATEETEPGRYRFENTSTHPLDFSMTYEWELDGEAAGSSTDFTHTFDQPGSYPVQLTATDREGETDTASALVTVAAPSLGASLALETESGTGAVKLDEIFGVTLRVAATDGVGSVEDITAAVPHLNASNLEVVSGPEVIDPFTLTPESHLDLTWQLKAASPGRFTLRSTPAGTDASGSPVVGNEAEANGSVGGLVVDVVVPEEPVDLEEKTEGERDENGNLVDPGFIAKEVPITISVSVPENAVAIKDLEPFETVEGDGGIDVDAVKKVGEGWADIVPQPVPFPMTWEGPLGPLVDPAADPPTDERRPLPLEGVAPGETVELALTVTVDRPGNYEVSSILEALTDDSAEKVVRGVGSDVLRVSGAPVLAVQIGANARHGTPPSIVEGEWVSFTGRLENLSLTDTIDLAPLRAFRRGQGTVFGPVALEDPFPDVGEVAIFAPELEHGEHVTFKIDVKTTALPGVGYEILAARTAVVLDMIVQGEVIDADGVRRELDPDVDITLDAGNGADADAGGIRVEVTPQVLEPQLYALHEIFWNLAGELTFRWGKASYDFFTNVPAMLKGLGVLAGAGVSKVISITETEGRAHLLAFQYAVLWADHQAAILLNTPDATREEILDGIATDIAELYEEEYGPIRDMVNQGTQRFFEGVLTFKGDADAAGARGDVGALIELTGDAMEVTSGVLIEEVTGQAILLWLQRAAKSEKVANALAGARQKLDSSEVTKLEAATDAMREAQVNPKVAPMPISMKNLSPGTAVNRLQAIRGWAVDAVSDANLRLLTSEKPVIVALRSRADETLEWLETALGITPKPVTIKPKNVNLDDCSFLGYRCGTIGYTPDGRRSLGDQGSVAMREPVSRESVIAKLDAAGLTGSNRERVLKRHNTRWKEWYGEACAPASSTCVAPPKPWKSKWQEMLDNTNEYVYVDESGLQVRSGHLRVPRQGHPPETAINFDTVGPDGGPEYLPSNRDIYDARRFELRESKLDDGTSSWEVWLEDHDGTLKRVSGDIDVVAVTNADGSSFTPNDPFAQEIALDLQAGIDAQHPWSSSLEQTGVGGMRDDFLSEHLWDPDPLKRGEPLLIYMNGEARVGWFDPEKYAALIKDNNTEPLQAMVWLEGGPNQVDSIVERQVDLRDKLVDPLSVETPDGHLSVESKVREALANDEYRARVAGDAAGISEAANRYATCAVSASRAPRAAAAVWRMGDRLQQRQEDGTWVDADPAAGCGVDGTIVVLPETSIIEDILAGTRTLPIIEDLLGFDWKDMFRVGDCITIDAGQPNEEKACIAEHGSLILDRELKFDHDRLSRVVMDGPGEALSPGGAGGGGEGSGDVGGGDGGDVDGDSGDGAECPAAGFTDVVASNVHAAAIDCLAARGVTRGTSETTFSPARAVTRGQTATFVTRLVSEAGGVLPADPPDAFTDDDGSVHERSVNQLAALAGVDGFGDGTYRSELSVTRGQMAKILSAASAHITGRPLASSVDHFDDDDGTEHEADINRIVEAGIARGLADGTYGPQRVLRRDQMASLLVNLLAMVD